MLVNVVDVPPLCNFILPAIVRTGPLAIAISTAGASPALAKRIKPEIAGPTASPTRGSRCCSTRSRLGQGHAADLPGPQGVLRGHRQRRPRPDRAARANDEAAVRELIAAAQRAHEPATALGSPRHPRRVLTVSTSVSRREAEDLPALCSPSSPRRRAATWSSWRSSPTTTRSSRTACTTSSTPGMDAHLHDRRHRLHAQRHHARGHARGDRARGAGFAEAMRAEGLQDHADGDPHPRRVGHRRPHAHRQLPGLAEVDGPALPGARADAAPRRRTLRGDSSHHEAVGPALADVGAGLRRARRARRGHAGGRAGARRSPSSAPTAPASRRCCASSPRCCARTAAARVLGTTARARLGGARAGRVPRPRPAALPRPDRAREPALPRAAARRREERIDALLEATGSRTAPATRCHALARTDPARRGVPRGLHPRRCCCSTSRARASTRARRAWSSR